VYGFDIVLDSVYEPWLIEINLSPACAERQGWLTKMLDDSAIDLLSYLEKKILVTN
jgi:tubulin monoglycylase TTLL3/8